MEWTGNDCSFFTLWVALALSEIVNIIHGMKTTKTYPIEHLTPEEAKEISYILQYEETISFEEMTYLRQAKEMYAL